MIGVLFFIVFRCIIKFWGGGEVFVIVRRNRGCNEEVEVGWGIEVEYYDVGMLKISGE